jgi:hypothetical protein
MPWVVQLRENITSRVRPLSATRYAQALAIVAELQIYSGDAKCGRSCRAVLTQHD